MDTHLRRSTRNKSTKTVTSAPDRASGGNPHHPSQGSDKASFTSRAPVDGVQDTNHLHDEMIMPPHTSKITTPTVAHPSTPPGLDPLPLKPGRVITLMEALRARPPRSPFLIATSKGTTNVANEAKMEAFSGPELRQIVALPKLVDQLIPLVEKQAEEFTAIVGDRFTASIDPQYTSLTLPLATFTEKDSEVIFRSTYLNPAITLLRYVKAKDASPNLTSHEIMAFSETEEFRQTFPFFISSMKGAAHISDFALREFVSKTTGPPDADVVANYPTYSQIISRLLVEMKTEAALRPITLDRVAGPFLRDIRKVLGWATQFIWPEGPSELKSEDRILIQVWCQMVHHGVRYSILSNGSLLYLLYRKTSVANAKSDEYSIDDTTLFISAITKQPIVAVYAWIALAANSLSDSYEVVVPEVNITWWNEITALNTVECPGVNLRTLPTVAVEILGSQEPDEDALTD